VSGALGSIQQANKLYIGKGVTIKGATILADTVVVDGVLEGDVSVGNLLVREGGAVIGRISVAQNAEIFGKVLEKLDVRGLLILRASSRVEGDVSCGTLTIEQGANITGGISSSDYRTALHAFSSHRKQDTRAVKAASSFRPLDFSALELPSPIAAGA
jgi:cytoskeletal protein CcmA (bactofilin family)